MLYKSLTEKHLNIDKNIVSKLYIKIISDKKNLWIEEIQVLKTDRK